MHWERERLHLITLLKRLGIILLIFTLMHPIFYLFNHDLFQPSTFREKIYIFLYALDVDVVTIIRINIIFIIMHLLPNPWRERRDYQWVMKFFYYVFNVAALIFEASDCVYYRYALKRTTSDIIFMKNDAAALAPTFLHDFWYIGLLIIAMVIGAEILYRRGNRQFKNFVQHQVLPKFRFIPKFHIPFFLVCAVVVFFGARGGISEPLNPNKAEGDVPIALEPLAQNTTFTLMWSLFNQQELEETNYMPQSEQRKIYNARYHLKYDSAVSFLNPEKKKLNVCFIIIESFSKEYTGYFNKWSGFTPFLDSLMGQSVLFTNAFANGKKSIEGIPAVLSSLPGLINNPMISSVYQTNKMESVATYLKTMGYYSAFFHGGHNGTMNFDTYTEKVGFDNYFGYNEFPNPKTEDEETWGIFDETFLQFMAKKMNSFPEPFCSAVFTLSSHHPFAMPEKYEGKFPVGGQPINEVIAYTDYSLRKFFASASKMPWFNNTLFVITADHCGPPEHDEYKTKVGIYEVPIIFYLPGKNIKQSINTLVQQTDILPTVLLTVGYEGKIFSFGKPMFETGNAKRYTVNFLGSIYQIIDERYNLLFDGMKAIELYDYRQDVFMKHNLIGEKPDVEARLTKQIEAEIQEFNSRVIYNQMTAQ